MEFLPLIEPSNGVTEIHVRLDVNAGHIDSSQPGRVFASRAPSALKQSTTSHLYGKTATL